MPPPCSRHQSSISVIILSWMPRIIWHVPESRCVARRRAFFPRPSDRTMLPFSDNIVTPVLELMRSGTTPADGIEMASSLNGLDGGILDRLYKVIESRRGADPAVSNTARLFAKGTEKIAQKVGEEAVETVIEGVRGRKKDLALESADLLYHLLVLWADRSLKPDAVWAALAAREGISGVAAKKGRKADD